MRFLLWCVGLIPALAACNALFGVDDLSYDRPTSGEAAGGAAPGGAGGSTGGRGGSGGEGLSCAAGYECRPSLPNIQYVRLKSDGDCEPGQSTISFADCIGCACGPATAGTCSATVELYSDGSCAALVETRSRTGGERCFDIPQVSVATGIHAKARVDAVPGSCAASQATVAPTIVEACEAPPEGTCDGGVCVPESATCAIVAEQTPCSAPYEMERAIYPDEASSCACSCSAEGSCPEARTWVYPGNVCDGSGVEVDRDDSCQATGLTDVDVIWIHTGAAATQCTAAGAASEPRTLCCLPP